MLYLLSLQSYLQSNQLFVICYNQAYSLIENNDSLNNIFSNENLDIENDGQSSSNEEFSSQAWVAEIGLDITDAINFAFQTVPGRDDISPLGILTFQANPNLELLGSYDSNGDWKSQVQLFFRY